MWTEIDKLRADDGLPERTVAALFDATIGLQVRNRGYRAQLRGWDEEISTQVAGSDLRAMVAAGLLQAHGRNRGAYHDAAAPLRESRNTTLRARAPIDVTGLFDPSPSLRDSPRTGPPAVDPTRRAERVSGERSVQAPPRVPAHHTSSWPDVLMVAPWQQPPNDSVTSTACRRGSGRRIVVRAVSGCAESAAVRPTCSWAGRSGVLVRSAHRFGVDRNRVRECFGPRVSWSPREPPDRRCGRASGRHADRRSPSLSVPPLTVSPRMKGVNRLTTPHRVPAEMFRFATGERSELYTAILHAFGEANERLETALGLEEVRARLRAVGSVEDPPDDELGEALDRLRQWQLVDVIQDQAGQYRTAAEYERRNLTYSLTRRGEAAFAGVTHALSVLASTGALQTAVLDAIADRLGDLAALLDDAASLDRRVFSTLSELESHLDALRTNTKQFNGELQRLLRADGADAETFGDVKAATVAYLEEFLSDLDRRAHLVATGVGRVESHGVAALHQRALLGAELPTHLAADPGPDWLAHRRARWEGLQAWFRPVDGASPRVEQLHTVARRAVVTLLAALDRITESRRRTSSGVADFRELARWFAAAPTDADLHRLWATAFGAAPARHAHLAHPDPELVAPSSTWSAAPAVPVSALLRTSGRTERFSRTGKVRDVTGLKVERARRAAEERAQLEAAWDHLGTDGPVRLSSFARLEHAMFERLLDLLGRALSSAADAEGRRRATTGDGRIEIVLRAPADGAEATLETPRGRFRGPDLVVDVRGGARRERRAVR